MKATTASLSARVLSTGLQAGTLVAMRQTHPSLDQAQFFAVQTVLGLQFLAEFGAAQAMLQRLRVGLAPVDREAAVHFYARYALLAGGLFSALIALVWLTVYDTKFAASAFQIAALCIAGALRLACVFLEVYIEGSDRVADAYRIRFVAVVASQVIMFAAMIWTTPMWAVICSALAYALFTLVLRASDVRTFFVGALRQRSGPASFVAHLRAAGRFQGSLMLSSGCGYLLFSGPVILASMTLAPPQVAEVGTAMLLASVASSLCGAVVAPRVVHITDAVLSGQRPMASRIERQLIGISASFFVAAFCGLLVLDRFHLKLLPPWPELTVAMAGYFCFTVGLILSFALRAEGRDRMLFPSLAAASGFVILSILALLGSGRPIVPLLVFAISQGAVFLPAAWLVKRRRGEDGRRRAATPVDR